MKNKVYCGECKHYSNMIINCCSHENNRKTAIDTRFEPAFRFYIFLQHARDLNKNNDCKNFESKNNDNRVKLYYCAKTNQMMLLRDIVDVISIKTEYRLNFRPISEKEDVLKNAILLDEDFYSEENKFINLEIKENEQN